MPMRWWKARALKRTARAIRTPSPGRMYKVGIAYFGPDPGVDAGMQGLLDGLRDLGFVEGQNLEIKKAHAQGEMGNIPSILQNYANQDLDLIVPMTTPLLTGAIGLVKKKPAVFTVVYDPIAAGAGPTRDNHVPNITGVGSFPPIPDTVQLIRDLVPGVRTVGTVYNSSEANSRKVIAVARDEFRRQWDHAGGSRDHEHQRSVSGRPGLDRTEHPSLLDYRRQHRAAGLRRRREGRE